MNSDEFDISEHYFEDNEFVCFAVQTFLAIISAATGEARVVRGKVLDFHLRCSNEKSMNGGR